MSIARHHAEWLSLIEISGPFLSMPVLMRVFPQGMIAHDSEIHRNLRQAHEEWEESLESHRPDRALHRAWVEFILKTVLEFKDEVIATGQAIQQTWQTEVREHDEVLRPDLVIKTPEGRPDAGKARMFVQIYPASQGLDKPVSGKPWKASPDTRMAELLKNTGVCLGLVTNGHRWMLVNFLPNSTAGFASWYANLWFEEPITLRAFRSLLSMERFFGVADADTLESMLAESAKNQQEVTEQLGYQVRRAVGVLIQSLDQADQDHGRELLGSVAETELYEAALTVMMRLVVLFCAEERGLLLLGDPLFDQHYAVSTLRTQLREAADQHGEEVLERRHDAWCRLLSTFRAVYGGVEHERMTLPAYGGNLFDPDRFPFLEGRKKATTWREVPCDPLPVNNRTVLHLLEALQTLQVKVPGGGPAESRRLSFRALDIEQIGHVYEGLFDHTAKRATEPVLGLVGAKDKQSEIALAELEKLNDDTAETKKKLLPFLKDETGKTEKALGNLLDVELFPEQISQFQAACGNDEKLWKRIKPFAGLVRDDDFGHPVVIPKGSVYVTEGTDRRSSGTHYTPRILTEPIVQYTLEPLVYVGPAEGKPKEEWNLRTPAELLELNLCDMACGSGAFLVQTCRYLAERLVESWEIAEKDHPGVPGITPEGTASTGKSGENLIPKETDERMIFARRIVAQRCLYGVDKNPLAAEMAKLSLWLLTLQKDKPFTFLDHAIRSGDSLVGIANTHQLTSFSLDEKGIDMPFFTDAIKTALQEVQIVRRQISELPDNSAEDVQKKSLMLRNAEEQTKRLAYAANSLLVACWESTSESDRDERLKQALVQVTNKFNDLPLEQLEAEGRQQLKKVGCPKPFHWPLDFPEVLMERGGFDGIVGNPPFMGGQLITSCLGKHYRQFIITVVAGTTKGSADLCAYFFLRSATLLRDGGNAGLIATNTISEGETRQVGLNQLVAYSACVRAAELTRRWPGTASLAVSLLWIHRGNWSGEYFLDGARVPGISSALKHAIAETSKPFRLASNKAIAFKGSSIQGVGFLLSPDVAHKIISDHQEYSEVLFPYLGGSDVTSSPKCEPTRWAINFFDWALEQAERFPICLEIVREKVKPQREKAAARNSIGKRRAEYWWRYDAQARNLYDAIQRLPHFWAMAETSKYGALAMEPCGFVFAHKVIVFATDSFSLFAALSSSIHQAWIREFGASLKTDIEYSVADVFETFPLPLDSLKNGDLGSGQQRISSTRLCESGRRFLSARQDAMLTRGEGLTSVYNNLHNETIKTSDLETLRGLLVGIDEALVNAYGWCGLSLGHGFHETKLGVRFTISEAARREVLARLLTLNHQRYAEEVAKGLHDKKKGGGRSKAGGRKSAAKSRAAEGPTLF